MTLSGILNEIYLRAGRNITSIESTVIGWINEHQKTFCKSYPYWFLTKAPQPLAAIPVIAGFNASGGSSAGYWLLTSAGQSIYPFNTVLTSQRVAQLKWVKKFDTTTGEFVKDLTIAPYSESTRYIGLLQGALATTNYLTSDPNSVSLIDYTVAGGHSHDACDALIFSPTPDDSYIYGVCISVDTLEALADDADTNFLTLNYPFLLVWLTLKDVGLYIGEDNLVALAEVKSADIIKEIKKEDKSRQIKTRVLYPRMSPPPYGVNNRWYAEDY
jgi:hypothetical protein